LAPSIFEQQERRVKINKKKVLIDCDGVLCDFMKFCIEYANNSGKVSKKILFEEVTADTRTYPFWTESGLEKAWKMQGFCSQLPVIPGSQEFVENLRSAGHEILFVTSPPKDNKTWPYERRKWLAKHFDAARTDVIFAVDKRYVSGLTLIDDHTRNCRDWNNYNQAEWNGKRFGPANAILVATPQNEDAKDFKLRTNNFKQIEHWVEQIYEFGAVQ
jgi:5'(3')-deoxyribonucleotidase